MSERALALSGVGLTLLGVAIGAYYGRRSRRYKRPVYTVSSVTLVEDAESSVNGLEVRYRSEAVSTLTVTKVALWNAGNETVDAADLSDQDPLRIEVVDGEILDVVVVARTSPVTSLSVSLADDNAARVRFDFLDRRQGGVVQVVHTGLKSDNCRLLGTIRGAGHPERRQEQRGAYALAAFALFFGPVFLMLWLSAILLPEWVGAAFTFFWFALALFLMSFRSGAWSDRFFSLDVPREISDYKLPKFK